MKEKVVYECDSCHEYNSLAKSIKSCGRCGVEICSHCGLWLNGEEYCIDCYHIESNKLVDEDEEEFD